MTEQEQPTLFDVPENPGHPARYTDALLSTFVRMLRGSRRVLSSGGRFILNIKDHIRNLERQLVTDWHIEALESLGFELIEHAKIDTPSMRRGQNSELRMPYESVIHFRRRKKS